MSTKDVSTVSGVEGKAAMPLPKHRRSIGTLQLTVLCYALVCGGPLGSETIVSSAGPFIGLTSTLLTALLWALPIALITAEVSPCLPHDGGYIVWAYVAHGKFWAVQQAIWSWVSGVVVNAVYVIICYDAAVALLGHPAWIVGYAIRIVAVAALCTVNFVGLRIMNRVLAVTLVLTLIPFAIMILIGLFKMHWPTLFEARYEGDQALPYSRAFSASGPALDVDLPTLVTSLVWNFNGFQATSMFAGEVADPATTYPRALALAVLLCALSYMLPLLVAAGVNQPPWLTWKDGSFTTIAAAIGGDWLGILITLTIVFSSAAMFVSELFSDVSQLAGMAELGIAPSFLAERHAVFDTPYVAIALSFVVMCLLVTQEFLVIVTVSNVFVMLSLLQMLASAAVLRARYPQIRARSALDMSTPLFLFIVAFSVAVATGATIVMLFVEAEMAVLYCCIGVVIFSVLYYFAVDAWIPDKVTQAELEAELVDGVSPDDTAAHVPKQRPPVAAQPDDDDATDDNTPLLRTRDGLDDAL